MTLGVRVAIVGAGFAGLGMAIELRRAGCDSFALLERAGDVGGIWRDNAYPGCACDIPSVLYSFSFERGEGWTRLFPRRDEIWEYLRTCARKYDLETKIRYGWDLAHARYDDGGWELRSSSGEELRADVLVLAIGALNRPQIPQIAGLERFAGPAFHSSQWDAAAELRGKCVAVMGTGASAVQIVPEIAPLVERLTLYQRTPAWIVPRWDRPVGSFGRRAWRVPGYARFMRALVYWLLEARAVGFVSDTRMLAVVERLARGFLEREIPDPELRRKLTPSYRMGCKRVLLSDDFYAALRRPNVELVTEPVEEFRERSIVAGGVERPADAAIFATGFRATEAPAIRIVGADGRELSEAWRGGMAGYLGSSISGFPNLFTLIGPNTGLGHNSMIVMMEAQYRYVLSALEWMQRTGAREFDVRREVQDDFNAGLQRRLAKTVWSTGCRSWYLDASGKNTTLWPGYTVSYRHATRRFDAERYRVAK